MHNRYVRLPASKGHKNNDLPSYGRTCDLLKKMNTREVEVGH